MYSPGARKGELYKTSETSTYQSIASLCVRMAMNKHIKYAYQQYNGLFKVRYWFYLDKDIDCSNAFKALEDSIAHELRINDARFLPEAVWKTTGVKDPRVIVEIGPALEELP